MLAFGFDPGADGGVVALLDGSPILARPLPYSNAKPSELDVAELMRSVRAACSETGVAPLAVVEKVHAMPGQGVTSMFSFGKSYGMLLGALAAEGIAVQLVTPQAWKKVVLQGTKKDKGDAVDFVRRRFPTIQLVQPRCRKPHDGIADAACMALYASIVLVDRDAIVASVMDLGRDIQAVELDSD